MKIEEIVKVIQGFLLSTEEARMSYRYNSLLEPESQILFRECMSPALL